MMMLPPADRTYWGICATCSHSSRVGIAATAGQRRKLHGTLQQNHRQPIETTYEPELGRRADEVFIRYAGQGGAEPPAGIRASTFRKRLSAAAQRCGSAAGAVQTLPRRRRRYRGQALR